MNFGKIKRYKSWLTSAAIAVAIAVWLASGQIKNEDTANAESVAAQNPVSTTAPRASVRVRHQIAEEVTRTITINGKTAPARVVELNAETDGRVIFIGAERGERLDRGDVIIRLDERDRKARLSQAEATVKQRELEFAAREKLKGNSYVSDAQLQEAAAQLEAAKAERTRAELDISYMSISAPFDGALQERMVEVGDFLSSGDPVATYVDDRTLVVSAAVSEFDARFVSKGETASAKLATGETVHGVIRYVAPVADEATRTFTVELAVDNKDGVYRAGTTAILEIPAETVMAQRIAPSLLTLDEEGTLGVKIVNESGTVEFHEADIALSSSKGVWIAGLPHSATIITVGQGFVNAGAIVEAVAEADIDSAVAIKAGKKDK